MSPHPQSEIIFYAKAQLLSRHSAGDIHTEPLGDDASLLTACVPIPAGQSAAAGLSWSFPQWHSDSYVFLPAGAYAGNRFPALRVPYSPRVPEHLVAGLDTRPYITDVPRLAHEVEGLSHLQLKSGDLAFPAFGFFDPQLGRAWLALANDPASATDWLWEVEENDKRNSACFRISSPGVRRSPVYRLPTMETPSPDFIPEGGPESCSSALRVQVHSWACLDIPAFLDRVFSIRNKLASARPSVPAQLPFSAARDLVEEHYHRDAWREELKVFASDCDPSARLPFQTGWCGGMIASYPLLASPQPLGRERAWKNLHAFFLGAPRASGFFSGRLDAEGRWLNDFQHDSARPYTHGWTLVRRQADALLYLLRQLALVEVAEPLHEIPTAWHNALRACADAFVRVWRDYGSFGQFLDADTGVIQIGHSASGGLVPAGLVAAWQRYQNPTYLDVACEAGEYFARAFLERGYTSGGPGDALQNPDSESAAALVESYAVLHTATGEARWLEHGRNAAALLATWVMPYDFPFPAQTEFNRLDVRTRGSVFANTQNKHSAPGLCTHAGVGLLHLYRASGDVRLLELACDIARFLPQTVSRNDRPIMTKDGRALPSGWINERVNTSDWDDNIGGVFYGSCWCEVSLLLTALELPGVYVRADIGRVWAFDHVEARLMDGVLRLENPTRFAARVRVLVDSVDTVTKPLSQRWFLQAPVIELAAGAGRELELADLTKPAL